MKKIFLCVVLLFVLSGQLVFASTVNINHASAQEIADNLEGVGLKKAQAIVQYRDKIGGFETHKQLLNVKGIGEATLQKNQQNIVLD